MRHCLVILLVGVCAAAPVAVVEAALALVFFGGYEPWWWLVAFLGGLLAGVAYHLIFAYNRNRPPKRA